MSTILHPLSELQPPQKIKDVFLNMSYAKQWLLALWMGNLVPLSQISKNAADQVYRALDMIIPEDTSGLDFEAEASPGFIYNVQNFVKSFETVFSAELQAANTYYVEQKGIYSTPDLIDRADLALGDSAAILNNEAKEDFKQAGRCLAFELPTAAAFHLARSMESVLRQYHTLVCPDSASELAANDRKPEMIKCINEIKKATDDPKLMDILDHYRDLHRNTTMHPEAFLTSQEGLRLFDITKSTLTAIADRISQVPNPGGMDELVADLVADGVATVVSHTSSAAESGPITSEAARA